MARSRQLSLGEVRNQGDVLKNDEKIKSQFGNVEVTQKLVGGKVFRVLSDLLDPKPRNLGEVRISSRKTETLPVKSFTRNDQF